MERVPVSEAEDGGSIPLGFARYFLTFKEDGGNVCKKFKEDYDYIRKNFQ